jgi:VanZ family protein
MDRKKCVLMEFFLLSQAALAQMRRRDIAIRRSPCPQADDISKTSWRHHPAPGQDGHARCREVRMPRRSLRNNTNRFTMPATTRHNEARIPGWTPKHSLLAALAFFICMVGIGAIPGKASALSAVVYDKALHFVAYSFLTALIYAGVQGRPFVRGLRTLLTIAALGTLDEFIQGAMPYRSASLLDWKTDMLAAGFCVALLMVLELGLYAMKRQSPNARIDQ